MKNTLNYKIILTILFSILILSSCGEKTEEEENKTSTGIIQEEEETFTGVIQEINNQNIEKVNESSIIEQYYAKQIGSLKCTMHMEKGGGVVDQVVYISGIKMRMDATTKYQGFSSQSHMISDGKYTYIWGTGGSFKMKVDQEYLKETVIEGEKETKVEDGKKSNNLKEILETIPNNKCVEWVANEDLFELPEGINFQDFNKVLDFNMDEKAINDTLKGLEIKNSSLENLPKNVNSDQIMESIQGLTPDQ